MKVKLTILFFIILIGSSMSSLLLQKKELFPSFDLNVPSPLPKSFRILSGPYEKNDHSAIPSRQGLEYLHASASGQITLSSLFLLAQKIPPSMKITIIDLREESHGFVNGLPISWRLPHTTWTNQGKNREMIEKDESLLLQNLLKESSVTLDPETKPLKIEIGHVQTEKELVESLGMRYLRIPITENHPPTDEQVERLVNFIDNLSENQWVHSHCHGGRGRATSFAALYDILKNSSHLGLEEILSRQFLVGGTNLLRIPRDFRQHAAQARVNFFKLFYAYSKVKGSSSLTFSDWKRSHSLNL